MASESVWVVMASTGEYSDRSEGPVCAYLTEAKARDRVEALKRAAMEQGVWGCDDGERRRVGCSAPKFEHEGFVMRSDYTGVWFDVMEVALRA